MSREMDMHGQLRMWMALLATVCVLAIVSTGCGKKAEEPRTQSFMSVEKSARVSDLILPSLVMGSKGELFLSLFIHSTFPSATDVADAIAILKSVDDGATWEEVGRIRSHLTYGAWGYDLAIDGQGNLSMTWVAALRNSPNPVPFKAVLYSRSGDGGRTWTKAIRVSTPATGQRRNPVMGVSGTNIHIAWLDRERNSSGTRGVNRIEDVYIASSSDGGATWSGSVCIETDLQRKTSSSGTPALLVTADGTVHCAYSSMRTRPKKRPLAGAWVTTSTDKGRSFATTHIPADPLGNIALTQADGVLCLAAVHITKIKSISMQNPQTAQEIHFYTSSDNAATWSDPARVDDDLAHQHKSNLRLIPLAPTCIAAVWHDERGGVYMAASPDSGKTWGINLKVAPRSHTGLTPLDIVADSTSATFHLVTSDIRMGRGDGTYVTKGSGEFQP
jgi:BNR repeat-like domain